MSEWTTTTIGEIAEIFDGPHATPHKTDTGPWFLSISSLNRGQLDLSQSAHLSEEDFTRWTRRVTPQSGDLLFSYETRLGEAALMPDGIRACLGRRMGILRPDRERVNPRFLLYAYLGPRFQRTIQERSVHGATVDRIPLTEMGKWPISLPPLEDQDVIAGLLGTLDDKIVVNNRITETALELGRIKFMEAVRAATPQEIALSEATTALTRGITPKYSESNDSVLVINQRCVRNNRVSLEPARKTLPEKVRESKLLRSGDVLVNSTGVGTLGRVARWTLDIQATVDTHVTLVRFDPSKVDPVCGGFALLAAQSEIEALGEGSTGQTELKRKRLGEFQITLPSDEAMKKLRPTLDSLEAQRDAAMAESVTLTELRDTLLPKLMSGEVKIKDAEKVVEDAV